MMARNDVRAPWIWDELDVPDSAEGSAPEPAVPTLDEQVEEAYQNGFRDGVARGRRDMEAELETALLALSAAATRMDELRGSIGADLEENAAALAVAVARELVVNELDRTPDTVLHLVREAVSSFGLDEPLQVRIHPADLALITAGGGGAVAGSRSVAWEPDPELPRGSCLVEGPGKVVDGRLDLALERIFQAITRG